MKFPLVHDEANLIQHGYEPLAEIPVQPDMPTVAYMRRLHMQFKVAYGGVRCFRTASGWKFYRDPKVTAAFVDAPLLPQPTNLMGTKLRGETDSHDPNCPYRHGGECLCKHTEQESA